MACNAAGLCKTVNAMPVAGGLLDQSAWFLDLLAAFESDKSIILNERING